MWPDNVRRVADFLKAANAEARLEEFSEGTPTAESAAKAAGVSTAQIVKSLVFVCDGRRVLALIPGDERADPRKIARATGASDARVATRDEVRAATGVEPGGVAPFPHPKLFVVIDRALLLHDHVWVGAGSPKHMARLSPQELVRLTRAHEMDAVAERA